MVQDDSDEEEDPEMIQLGEMITNINFSETNDATINKDLENMIKDFGTTDVNADSNEK